MVEVLRVIEWPVQPPDPIQMTGRARRAGSYELAEMFRKLHRNDTNPDLHQTIAGEVAQKEDHAADVPYEEDDDDPDQNQNQQQPQWNSGVAPQGLRAVANHRCLEPRGRSFWVARWRFFRTIWIIAHNPSNSPKTSSPPSPKTMIRSDQGVDTFEWP